MKPYCEIVSQYILPTMRALIAKRLMEKYKLTQEEIASKLGLTQSAISQYMRDLRGSKIKFIEKDEKVSKKIEDFVDMAASEKLNSLKLLNSFCGICKTVRKRKLLCNIHMKIFPDLKDCRICLE